MLYQNFVFAQPCIGSCLKKISLHLFMYRVETLVVLESFTMKLHKRAFEKSSECIVCGSLLDI